MTWRRVKGEARPIALHPSPTDFNFFRMDGFLPVNPIIDSGNNR